MLQCVYRFQPFGPLPSTLDLSLNHVFSWGPTERSGARIPRIFSPSGQTLGQQLCTKSSVPCAEKTGLVFGMCFCCCSSWNAVVFPSLRWEGNSISWSLYRCRSTPLHWTILVPGIEGDRSQRPGSFCPKICPKRRRFRVICMPILDRNSFFGGMVFTIFHHISDMFSPRILFHHVSPRWTVSPCLISPPKVSDLLWGARSLGRRPAPQFLSEAGCTSEAQKSKSEIGCQQVWFLNQQSKSNNWCWISKNQTHQHVVNQQFQITWEHHL